METVGSVIENHYVGKTPNSRALYERAQKVIPGGVTHDVRVLKPYPISMERAQGSRKWDVDGNEYVDYFGGHGAFLLGHNHPAVVEAVTPHTVEDESELSSFGAQPKSKTRKNSDSLLIAFCMRRKSFRLIGKTIVSADMIPGVP